MGGTNNLLGQGSTHSSGSKEAGDGTVAYRKLGKRLEGKSTNKDCADFVHSRSRNINEPLPCHAVYAPRQVRHQKNPR